MTPNSDTDASLLKTLNPAFKGVVFKYLEKVLHMNQQNYKNFTFIVCNERFLVTQLVFYFRKNHYLVIDVNYSLSLLHTNGVIQHISSRFLDRFFLHVHKKDLDRIILQIDHFFILSKIIGMPYGTAIMVFVVELLRITEKIKFIKKKFSFFQKISFGY